MTINVYSPNLAAWTQYTYTAEGATSPSILVAHRRRIPLVMLAYELDGDILLTTSPTGIGNWSTAAEIAAGTCPFLLDDPATRRVFLFYYNSGKVRFKTQDAGGSWSSECDGPTAAACTGLSARASHIDGEIVLVWTDGTDIYLSGSDDGGGTWDTPAAIAAGTYPHLLLDRGIGRRWLTYWRDAAIYMRRADHGGSFGSESALDLPEAPIERAMTMRVLSNRTAGLALWYTKDGDELVTAVSNDGGATWS